MNSRTSRIPMVCKAAGGGLHCIVARSIEGGGVSRHMKSSRLSRRQNQELIRRSCPGQNSGLRFLCSSSTSPEGSIAEILQREFGLPDDQASKHFKAQRSDTVRLSRRRRAFVEESMVAVTEIMQEDEAEEKDSPKKTGLVSKMIQEGRVETTPVMSRSELDTGKTLKLSSAEVIRLMMDRLKGRKWLELERDMKCRQIELKPAEVAWVLRVQRNAMKAWDFFKWAASRPGYRHDSTCYAIMISLLGRASEYNLLEELLDDIERRRVQCSISTINTLIGIYATPERIDQAEKYYRKLRQLGLRPNAYTYKCMLQAFAKAGKSSKALEIYRTAQRERQPLDNISYNMLLDALARDGQVGSAWKVFDDMKKIGYVADVFTYTILVRMLGHAGMTDRALKMFDKMVASGIKANKYTFNTLLLDLAKQGKVEEGLNLFKKMLKDGVNPDFFTYQSILNLLCKGGKLDGAFEVLGLSEGKTVRKEAYENFIKILGKMGYVREVRTLFQRMGEEGLKHNRSMYLSMIDTLCRAGEPEEALIIMKDMEQNGNEILTSTCNSVIAALRKNNKFPVAYDLFKKMKEKGPSPDTVTYNTLISGLGRAGKLEVANRLFDEMERLGCMPNVISYNSLIHSFARVGDVDSTCRFLTLMQDKGITPDAVTYNSVIECFGRTGKPDIALKVFHEMKEKGCSPSFITYNNLLHCLAKAGLTGSVLSLFEQMKEQGCAPDAMTFTILSRVYDTSPDLDKGQLLAEIQNSGLAYEVGGQTYKYAS